MLVSAEDFDITRSIKIDGSTAYAELALAKAAVLDNPICTRCWVWKRLQTCEHVQRLPDHRRGSGTCFQLAAATVPATSMGAFEKAVPASLKGDLVALFRCDRTPFQPDDLMGLLEDIPFQTTRDQHTRARHGSREKTFSPPAASRPFQRSGMAPVQEYLRKMVQCGRAPCAGG